MSINETPHVVFEPGFAPKKPHDGKFELSRKNDNEYEEEYEEEEEEEEEPVDITWSDICAAKMKP